MKKVFSTLVGAILCCVMLFAFVGCGEESTQSTLCGIEEAYANGMISKDDLRSIAYYYNGEEVATDFTLIPKTPESLSGDTIKKIKQTYYDNAGDGKSEATVDDVNIAGYYGTYNGCVIVEINASCMSGIGGDPIYYPEYKIGDVVFHSYTPLKVWKETDAYHKTITTAYAKKHNVDESEIEFTCYAEFDGVHVLMFKWAYPDAESEETVDGVVFHHSQIKTFDVYSNGEFYSLQEAFNNGLVTHDNLLTLRDLYNPQQNG